MDKKKWIVSSLALLSGVMLAACGNGDEGEGSEDTSSDRLVVYSPNSEGLIEATIPAFEEEYGVTVELIQAGTGELFQRLESEANSPVADVVFGGSYTQYEQHTDLFQEYVSKYNDDVIEEYQNETGLYTPYTLDGSVIVVNPDLTEGMEINGYADLLNTELQGRISTSDPSNSSSAFAQLTNMLQAMGGYDSDEAWEYVEDIFTIIDGRISSSSSNVYRTVADGEMSVGLSYEDPTVGLLNDGANIEVVYPEEGTVFLPASAAIIDGAENLENAQLFIDWIVSQEIQNVLATTTTNRPVREDVETSENMVPFSEIETIQEDMDYVIENRDEILSRFNDIFVEIESNR